MAISSAIRSKVKVSWLDLRGSGLSAIERLSLEEALLRHDPQSRSWAIVGTHEPTRHRFLKNVPAPSHVANSEDANKSCIIVMGIGGKPLDLLNLDLVRQDGVTVIKRFSGGGTVVLDHSSIWTTFIGRTTHFQNIQPYPRDIMRWSSDSVFDQAFAMMKNAAALNGESRNNSRNRYSLVMDTKSCGVDSSNRTVAFPSLKNEQVIEIPDFALRENDYVLGERKMGGNAQSIVNNAWLHHTSFLWDYEDEHMDYLSLPKKRPDYRGDRNHDDFLVKLNSYYGNVGKSHFFTSVKKACSESFDLEPASLNEAMEVLDRELGGMQLWFDGKCRTKVIELCD